MARFEFDPSWVVIKLLVALRLISFVADMGQGRIAPVAFLGDRNA